jgi:AraC-like DNA-binding protein
MEVKTELKVKIEVDEKEEKRSKNTEKEQARIHASHQELIERIGQTLGETTLTKKEVLPGLFFHRSFTPTGKNHSATYPSFCVIAQGSKEVILGEQFYRYDPAHYLIATAELPVVTQIIQATSEEPYYALSMQLDPNLVSSLLMEAGHPSPRGGAKVKAIDVSPLDADLLEAVVRLVRLVELPDDARILAPLVQREIVYRLLRGAQSERLTHLALFGGQLHRMIKVIEKIRKNYDKPLRMEVMAQENGMSLSGFHHHFKAVTAMSPLQFQKQLRLQEARRLILTENLDATSAGYRVGYEDVSHFSREYKSLFGNPPMRDAEQLREIVGQVS